MSKLITGGGLLLKQGIKLPAPVAAICETVEELEAAYPSRRFASDGYLVGSIGEAIAAEAFFDAPSGFISWPLCI